MKKDLLTLFAFFLALAACESSHPVKDTVLTQAAAYDSTDQTNDFYDNEPVFGLTGSNTIGISGEVAQPVEVSLTDFVPRSVVVKETRIENGEIRFTGAYRYEGISLYDIVNKVKVVKKNAAEFKPIIDQYVVVYGAAGDSVTISWGELYYPVQRHQILIANKVMRIVPSKSKDQWPLPEKTRLIVGSDLLTGRNISEPVRIVVRSLNTVFNVDRDIKMWAPEMVISGVSNELYVLNAIPESIQHESVKQVFYGRGKGIHGITLFNGIYLKELFLDKVPVSAERIMNGLFVIAAVDGYRCAMTYSELMNRNDNEEVMLIGGNNYEKAGKFSCLFAADFFSDRAIKSITEIRMVQGNGN
ncbi:MAG: hypothetical protein V2A67_03215 [Bacteroidota bacterium]